MLRRPIIQQLLAGIMLMLFAFSVTPKIFLHTLAANHKDRPAGNTENTPRITTAGFSCNCESVVAESSFEQANRTVSELIIPIFFLTHQDKVTPVFISPGYFVFGLRGPPRA